jgi:hypothetical protein
MGFNASGWLRRMLTSDTVMPSMNVLAAGPVNGLTMMTSVGVGVAEGL